MSEQGFVEFDKIKEVWANAEWLAMGISSLSDRISQHGFMQPFLETGVQRRQKVLHERDHNIIFEIRAEDEFSEPEGGSARIVDYFRIVLRERQAQMLADIIRASLINFRFPAGDADIHNRAVGIEEGHAARIQIDVRIGLICDMRDLACADDLLPSFLMGLAQGVEFLAHMKDGSSQRFGIRLAERYGHF